MPPKEPRRLLRDCLAIFIVAILVHIPPAVADRHVAVAPVYTVGFAQDTLANDWRVAQVESMREAFAQHPNIKFIYTDGQGQTARQAQDIEDLIQRRVDVLIASPRDGRLLAPVIGKAYRQGIPVVLVTRGIVSDEYTTLVAPDDKQIAHQAATYMAGKLGGRGRVLMLRGVPTASTAIARTVGFLDEIGKHKDIEVVAIKDGNYLRADAIKAVDEAISEGIEFDAIYAQSDSMASGARLALRKLGIDVGKTLVVGIDYISEAREAIRIGEQSASFLYPTCAPETVEVVLRLLAGKKPERHVRVESKLITLDNVDQISPIF